MGRFLSEERVRQANFKANSTYFSETAKQKGDPKALRQGGKSRPVFRQRKVAGHRSLRPHDQIAALFDRLVGQLFVGQHGVAEEGGVPFLCLIDITLDQGDAKLRHCIACPLYDHFPGTAVAKGKHQD